MKNKNLIVIPNQLPKQRARLLFEEFQYAWERTSTSEKKRWAKQSLKLFGKVTFRRGRGLILAMISLFKIAGKETINFGISIYNKKGKLYLKDKKEELFSTIKNGSKKSRDVSKNIYKVLKKKPKEIGPIMFLGILGFFCGSGGFDGDGGVPDLDITFGGIGNHRSIFFHSIISAAVLETIIFSSVNAINILHSKLPENHDSFWDKVVNKNDWAKAFTMGACTGITYHLLIDGTIQGNKALADFPIKGMPMEFHNSFFITNAAAEGLDINKKEI